MKVVTQVILFMTELPSCPALHGRNGRLIALPSQVLVGQCLMVSRSVPAVRRNVCGR